MRLHIPLVTHHNLLLWPYDFLLCVSQIPSRSLSVQGSKSPACHHSEIRRRVRRWELRSYTPPLSLLPAPTNETQQGRVYTAIEVEHPNGRVVALKKSRVSIKFSRTLLLYEAQVLCLLQGHPGIPEIYAWGHLEHFEYISMELLGGEISFEGREVGERTAGVAVVASQMVRSLLY